MSKEEPLSRKWLRYLPKFHYRKPRNTQQLLNLLKQCLNDRVIDIDSLIMIEGVCHMSEMQVRDIMIPRSQMKVILKSANLQEILHVVTQSKHSRFPVMGEKQDSVEGILLSKDLLHYTANANGQDFQIKDILMRPVIVPESKGLQSLLSEFQKTRNHMAIVVDEYGGVSGLVTIEDALEQIVGDITDEHDVEEEYYIIDHGNNQYLVKGLTPLEDFNQYFDSNLNHKSIDTIGGLVINAFGHLPQRGEVINIGTFSFEVSRADARRVHVLLMRKNT